jgi:SAM-dependent methyltransferase
MPVVADILKAIDRRFAIKSLLKGEPWGGFDLRGEKELEWSWVISNLPPPPKRCLDIGCCYSPITPTMVAMGNTVMGIDLEELPYRLSGLTFVKGDFNSLELPEASFDVVVLCSVVEHIGLAGRFGVKESDPDGDLKAMQKVKRLLADGGVLLLTIPVGEDWVFHPWHRVYGRSRLPFLLEGWTEIRSRFFTKQPDGPWSEATREQALSYPKCPRRYALGQFVLTPKGS